MERKSSGYDNYRQGTQNASRNGQRRQAAPQRGQNVSQRGQNTAQRKQAAPQRGQAAQQYRRPASASYDNQMRSSGRNSRNNTRKNMRNSRRRRRRSRITAFLILFLVLAVICGAGAVYLYQSGQTADSQSGIMQKITNTVKNGKTRKPGKAGKAPDVTLSLDSLDSPYAIMIDAATGTVMSSKQGEVTIYPASMAKIMTVFTAIEHIKDLDQKTTMSHDYYNTLYERDASRAGFDPGEEAVIRDLLYGALLPSGAECCMQLAIEAAGSEEAFAQLMNQKVQELGLTQTHFVNCTGLHSEEQYSTPKEIGLILQAALDNKTFREVFMTHSYSVKPTNVHPEGFTFWSSMFKNMQAENVIGGEILGGKTGYTDAAGYCLASMAEVEGREYIQVTAGWAANPRVSLYHINDAFLGYNALGRALSELKQK